MFNHSTLVEPSGLTRSWPRNERAELFVTVNVISPRPSPPVGTRSLAVVMAKILFIVKLLESFQSRCGRARYRESLLRLVPHVIQPPSFVAGLFNSLSQFAEEVQNELAFVVR